MKVLRELGVAVAGSAPPLHRYQALSAGKLHLLPTTANGLADTTLLGRKGKAALAGVLGRLREGRTEELEGISVDEWVASLTLPADAEPVLRAILRLATYASELASFGVDAAVAQLQLAAGGVRYLHGGWAQLYQSLAAKVEVRPRARVTGLEPAAGRIEVATSGRQLVARRVVVAAGTPEAAWSVLPGTPGWAISARK